ncbi:cytochrome B (plasmid) [Sulfitobacter alexandrii]|uniref:Cytochrome B n=1 Tax=Sulfitobacter alexandrii TaxID=1917485 RepID=A0A1J0WN59_9RHOB|nr:cytochrome B [Sulfitobacter alexandrii]
MLLPGALLTLGGCGGAQSALNTSGQDAVAIATLFWVMLGGAVVLWLLLNGAFYYASQIAPGRFDKRYGRHLLIGGGIVLPVVVLTALLVWGLNLLPDSRRPGDGLVVRVTGEQWWWRVEYWPEGAEAPIVSANEIRLPAGQRTEIHLTAANVIHSFWVPALGGKMDMFPGRDTMMSVAPERTGTFRGQCAEFCGVSHAWMAFAAVVMPPEAFDDWLAAEAGGAAQPADDRAARGAALFLSEGCGACHAIRGTEAAGQVGPDLTHVGSRQTLGAGRLTVTLQDLSNWISHTEVLKPGAQMPSYDLDPADLGDLAYYLEGLK